VCATYNRSVADGKKLWAYTCAGSPLGEISFTLPARDDQKARPLRQRLWARQVEISDGKAGRLSVTCVVAREVGIPTGSELVEWHLLTNRFIETVEQAVELIEWYRTRWEIEIYCHVIKNGCKVGELQLSSIDRIERALALFIVVACRVAYLMRMGRTLR